MWQKLVALICCLVAFSVSFLKISALPVLLPDELAELAAGRDDDDDDDVVQAILRAREKHRKHPPPISCDDGVSTLSFHPQEDLIAVGTFTGDISV